MDIFQKRFNKFKNSILKKDYSLFIIQKKENIFYLKSKQLKYNQLFNDTVEEIEKIKFNK